MAVLYKYVCLRVAAIFPAEDNTPAFRRASASLVRIEIRLCSISTTNPKAKQSTLLLIELSNECPLLGRVKFDSFFQTLAHDRHEVRLCTAQA